MIRINLICPFYNNIKALKRNAVTLVAVAHPYCDPLTVMELSCTRAPAGVPVRSPAAHARVFPSREGTELAGFRVSFRVRLRVMFGEIFRAGSWSGSESNPESGSESDSESHSQPDSQSDSSQVPSQISVSKSVSESDSESDSRFESVSESMAPGRPHHDSQTGARTQTYKRTTHTHTHTHTPRPRDGVDKTAPVRSVRPPRG